MTVKPTPFTLRVPDADIADLRDRLARARFPDHQAPGEPWAYGTDVAYLRGLTEYWHDHFDWRAAEAALNAFPQFRVPLDGVDLPPNASNTRQKLVFVFCCVSHGWIIL